MERGRSNLKRIECAGRERAVVKGMERNGAECDGYCARLFRTQYFFGASFFRPTLFGAAFIRAYFFAVAFFDPRSFVAPFLFCPHRNGIGEKLKTATCWGSAVLYVVWWCRFCLVSVLLFGPGGFGVFRCRWIRWRMVSVFPTGFCFSVGRLFRIIVSPMVFLRWLKKSEGEKK